MTEPRFYAKPAAHRLRLEVAPALASWDKVGSPGRVRMEAFIDHIDDVAASGIAATPGPLAISLEIGLPEAVPLLALNDLDNYLFPLVPVLAKRTGRQFVSAWAVKRHAAESHVTVGSAVSVPDPGGARSFRVKTSASYETRSYKEEIRDQVAAATPLPDGSVILQIAFTVGPGRTWPNLWKPTIDALGPILGRDDGAQEWNIRDGRVTELGLHGCVDTSAGRDVVMAIRADSQP